MFNKAKQSSLLDDIVDFRYVFILRSVLKNVSAESAATIAIFGI